MNRYLRGVALSLMLVPSMGTAQDSEAGLAAAKVGDFATAFGEWKPLAELGDASAQYSLGFMYDTGQGVLQDFATAHMWFNLSAAKGTEGASSARDEMANRLSPSDVSEAQRRARECLGSGYQDCD